MKKNNSLNKNFTLFNNTEFYNWAEREGLILEEQFLFDKYVYPQGKGINILDIGTGGGRFLFELAKKGFKNLSGIDLAERLLSVAIERSKRNYPWINFYKMSASDLNFHSNIFDLVIALQQIICFIEDEEGRIKAFNECYRVLKPGGMFVVSFLHYTGRWYNRIISAFTLPIKFFKRDLNYLKSHYLPWLKLKNKINVKFLFKKQPYTYWFELSETIKILEKTRFEIVDIKTSRMIRENSNNLKVGGMLYVVAKK